MSLITLHSSLNIPQFSKLTHFVSYLGSYNSKFCIKYWDPFIVLHQNLDWSIGIKICLVISFSFIFFFFHFTPILNFHKKLVLVKFFKLTQSFLLLNWHFTSASSIRWPVMDHAYGISLNENFLQSYPMCYLQFCRYWFCFIQLK